MKYMDDDIRFIIDEYVNKFHEVGEVEIDKKAFNPYGVINKVDGKSFLNIYSFISSVEKFYSYVDSDELKEAIYDWYYDLCRNKKQAIEDYLETNTTIDDSSNFRVLNNLGDNFSIGELYSVFAHAHGKETVRGIYLNWRNKKLKESIKKLEK